MSNKYSDGWSTDDVDAMRASIMGFQTFFWRLFVTNCENGINTLKFHLFDHLIWNVCKHRQRTMPENPDTALCRRTFYTLCDHLKPKKTSLSNPHLVQSGEIIPFQALPAFKKNKRNHGWDGYCLRPQLCTSLELDVFPELICFLMNTKRIWKNRSSFDGSPSVHSFRVCIWGFRAITVVFWRALWRVKGHREQQSFR